MSKTLSKYGSLILTLPVLFEASQLHAQELNKAYQAPSRGFFIEQGNINAGQYTSLELHTGADNLDTGGGIRLGLPNAELVINSGLDNYDTNTNEVSLKWGMPSKNFENKDSTETSNTSFDWSLIGSIGTINRQDDTDQTNIKFGAAATIKADAGTFTLAPYLVLADSDSAGGVDDTFVEVDFGAHVGLIDTQYGLFSAGLEFSYSSQDDIDEQIALGARWLYNEKVNMDIVPLIFNNNDVRGLPGLVRLNIVF